jgi:hypothetical protein
MKFLRGLALLSLLWCVSTHAEQSTLSTGDYYDDLGTVRMAIRGIVWYKDICADSFPSLKNENDEAYRAWRKKYLPFLQEMQRHSNESLGYESQGDSAKGVKIRIAMEKRFAQYKEIMRKQLTEAGPDTFQYACRQYPVYLHKMDRGNIEYFYAEQVATIRKGETQGEEKNKKGTHTR